LRAIPFLTETRSHDFGFRNVFFYGFVTDILEHHLVVVPVDYRLKMAFLVAENHGILLSPRGFPLLGEVHRRKSKL
jgi:hypothetical protein